jgi:uncharacterized protein (TIGR02145 family)
LLNKNYIGINKIFISKILILGKFNSVILFILVFLVACKSKVENPILRLDGFIEHAEAQTIELQALSYTTTETIAQTVVGADGKFFFEIKLAAPGMYMLRLNSYSYWIFLLENRATKIKINAENTQYSHAEISTDRGKSFSNALRFIEHTLEFQDSLYSDFAQNGYINQNTFSYTDSLDVLVNRIILDRIIQEEDPVIIAYLLKWIDYALNFEFMGNQMERLKSIVPDAIYTKELTRIYELLTLAVEQEQQAKQGLFFIDSSLYYKDFETVQIGDQVWMAENLNTPTPNSWCLYDDPKNCEKYGRVYNWYDAQIACPPGWHLPTDEEWMEMEMFLGMSEDEVYEETWRGENVGGKLKTTDNSWDQPNVGATNASGFNGVPCGPRNKFGMYGHFGHNAIYWTASSYGVSKAIYRYLGNSRNDVGRSSVSKYMGFYVRCVKD